MIEIPFVNGYPYRFGDDPAQPVGEYPDVPCETSAKAFDALDSLCKELEAVKKAYAELREEYDRRTAEYVAAVDAVRAERDTAKAADMRRGW